MAVSMTAEPPSQPIMTRHAMEVENLSFRYGSDQQGRAWTIEGVSFGVRTGEVLGIVGPNGSGKSSLLKLLAGLLRPYNGDIRLGGYSIGRLEPREIARSVAVVPQEYAQVFPFTVTETVLMGRFPHRRASWWSMGIGDETEQDVSCVQEAMSATDVVPLADRLMSDLSGGERQRVVIARALAQEPAILLLDEPMAFLDINHQIEICTLISRLKAERQLTVVLVSHDLNVASQLCDRVLMLRDGRLCRMGPPEDTIMPDVLRMVYGCEVVVDAHPQTGRPRVTIPVGSGQI
ncbi:MAG: ABC transporter ATP-binding protein [Nitrospira sp.]|jgi:iron complex transport system ATP-binding protein|nr:ABC transporter ATP-binding protein [Nitrospira sp.]